MSSAAIRALCLWPAGLALMLVAPHGAAQQTPSTNQADIENLRSQALEEAEAGKTADAIRDLQKVLTLQPDWKEGWWNLGMLEYSARQFPDAERAFEKETALAPGVGNVWALLGLCEYEGGDYDKALEHLERAQTLGIRDDEEIARVAIYHLGLLYVRSGRFEPAANVLRASFGGGAIPEQAKLALGLAVLHIPLLPQQLDPSREALVVEVGEAAANEDTTKFAALVKANPDAPNLRAAYEKAMAGAGHKDGSPDNSYREVEPEPRVMQFYANAAFKAGAAATDQNAWNQSLRAYVAADYATAETRLKAWLASNPSNGTAWALLGLCEFALRDYDNALIHLDRSARLGMSASTESIDQARYAYGVLLVRAGRFDEADAVLAKAWQPASTLTAKVEFVLGLSLLRRTELPESANSRDADLIRAAGRISALLQQSKYDEAFPQFKSLIERYPKAPFLHYAYGTALLAVSEFDEASAQMQTERTISPRSELPCVRLASIALRRHDAEHAVKSAQCALELNHDSVDAHYLLGRASLEAGNTTAAVRELEIAARLSPASPEIHFNLGRAYARANMPEKAQREREIFTQLNEAQQASGAK